MDWLHLPSQCIINKEIPLPKLMDQLRRKNQQRYDHISPDIASCQLYACLKHSTYPLDIPKDKDEYRNEILFINVSIRQYIDLDYFTRYLLRIFMYQAVIIYQLGDEYCLAAGQARDSKIVPGNRKVAQYYISPWIGDQEISTSGALDIIKMSHANFENLYQSIYEAIQEIGKDRYITLSFVADLYAYTHGNDVEKDWHAHFDLHKTLKERYPQNREKTKNGQDVYRFSEEEVFGIVQLNQGYVTGVDLIDMLHNFREYEEDFKLTLPEQLDEKVRAYAEEMYNDLLENIMDNVLEPVPDIGLDEQDDFIDYKPVALYEY